MRDEMSGMPNGILLVSEKPLNTVSGMSHISLGFDIQKKQLLPLILRVCKFVKEIKDLVKT